MLFPVTFTKKRSITTNPPVPISLGKKPEFTKVANLRALQSWSTRIKLGMEQAKSEITSIKMDIRKWFSPISTKHLTPPLIIKNPPTPTIKASDPHILTESDSEQSFDTVEDFFQMYPDENPLSTPNYTHHTSIPSRNTFQFKERCYNTYKTATQYLRRKYVTSTSLSNKKRMKSNGPMVVEL